MLRARSNRGEQGFTLVELLVVILIIGILSAIAIPAFTHQRARAQDAYAKTRVVTAVKALESWRTDHDGFAGVTPADLEGIEPTLSTARGLSISPAGETYEVSVTSASGTSGGGPFRIRRAADGTMTRLCDGGGRGGCLADGTW
jgi:type IV pilus assembly protein PilA